MPTRDAISNLFITVVVLFFMALLGMLLKARYRLPSERQTSAGPAVPKAIPIPSAVAVAQEIKEPETVHQSGGFFVLVRPSLVVNRGNEPDALRIRNGNKEDVFVLYFVEALPAAWTHPLRVNEQAAHFGHVQGQKVVEMGGEALNFVTQLLTNHPFKVYTKRGRVPESERFYAMIAVELTPGKMTDLGELLVRNGFATPVGQKCHSLPFPNKTVADYLKDLKKAEAEAKGQRSGLWAHANLDPPKTG